MRGHFFVIEGIDGSGKTTQAQIFSAELTARGIPHITTREPIYDGEAGATIKAILQGKAQAAPLERQKLFVVNRRWHINNVVLPALAAGKHVVCDRYFFSTIAYGSIDLPADMLIDLNREFRVPDLTIICDAPADICLPRIRVSRPTMELFEHEDKLRKARVAYRTFKHVYPNIREIDATATIETVAAEIKKIAAPLLEGGAHDHAAARAAAI